MNKRSSAKSRKDPYYFLQDSDSELNINEKLNSMKPQQKKFLMSVDNKPMSEISEISKSLDSDANSSSGETQNYGAHSDFKVVQSATEAQNIAKNPRKSMQSNDYAQPLNKYRNSNVISFGKGHFSVYQKTNKTNTQKGEVSILEEKDEYEGKPPELINRTEIISPDREPLNPLKEMDLEENKGEINKSQSYEHVSTKSKGIQRTLYNVISNFYLAKKFISILRNATIFRRPKWLNPVHFKMINDRSFYKEGWLDNYREILDEKELEENESSMEEVRHYPRCSGIQ